MSELMKTFYVYYYSLYFGTITNQTAGFNNYTAELFISDVAGSSDFTALYKCYFLLLIVLLLLPLVLLLIIFINVTINNTAADQN